MDIPNPVSIIRDEEGLMSAGEHIFQLLFTTWFQYIWFFLPGGPSSHNIFCHRIPPSFHPAPCSIPFRQSSTSTKRGRNRTHLMMLTLIKAACILKSMVVVFPCFVFSLHFHNQMRC